MFFKINTNLQNYIVEWNQHVRLVDLHRKHPEAVRGNAHLRPSIQYTYFPMVWCCLFGFRAIMYLMARRGLANVDEAWREFWLRAGEKYTRSSSMNIQISILIWTLNYFLVTIADFRLTVDVLKFMIVYSVGKPWGRTRPKDLGLSRKDYDSVVRLRTIVLVLLRFSIISITIMVFVFELHHSWETNQFSKYFFYTIASWLGGSYWVLHICQACYSVPGHIIMISHYLKLRQQRLVDQARRMNGFLKIVFQFYRKPEIRDCSGRTPIPLLNNRIRTQPFVNSYFTLTSNYGLLLTEMDSYFLPLTYYTTVLYQFYCTIIVFIIYILFLNKLDHNYVYLFAVIFWASLTFLGLTIHFASRVPSKHGELVHELRTFNGQLGIRTIHESSDSSRGGGLFLLPVRIRIKIENQMENLAGWHQVGLVLWNDFHLDRSAFFQTFFYIGGFFLLFFRRGRGEES